MIKKSVVKSMIRDKVRKISSRWPLLKEVIHENSILTGGAITNMLLGLPVNDWDFYFKSIDAAKEVLHTSLEVMSKVKGLPCQFHVEEFDEVNIRGESERLLKVYASGDTLLWMLNKTPLLEASRDIEYMPVFVSHNAITLTGCVQWVTRFYGSPGKIHDSYDFVHATCWYDLKTDHLELPEEALKSILFKELKYTGSLYPLSSLFRIRKFIDRGWTIDEEEVRKILKQLRSIDLGNIRILKEQLRGIDTMYLRRFNEALRDGEDVDILVVLDELYRDG